MSLVTPLQSSFNGGEISPRLRGRIDQNFYAIGVAEMAGFLPTMEGPAEACPGFLHVAKAKGGDAILFAHEFAATQGYVIEAGTYYFRFFTNEAQIMDGAAPYEIAHPYTLDELKRLVVFQAGEFLYLYIREHQTRILVRTSATTFELRVMDYKNGPFERRNDDEAVKVSASNVTGTVTLTANQPIFAAGDVGGLFRIEAGDLGTIRQWSPGISGISTGMLCQNNAVVYECVGGTGRTGDVAPVHGEGIEWDGIGTGKDINDKNAGGVQWKYKHDRYGVLKITGFTDAYNVTATVQRHLPMTLAYTYDWTFDPDGDPSGSSQAAYTPLSHRWSFGALSPRRGWPECGCIAQERHVVGRDNGIYGSVIGDFDDFAPLNEFGDAARDMGFTAYLRPGDVVRWIAADKDILVGTDRGEFVLSAAASNGGFGPGNIKTELHSEHGSAAISPVMQEGRVLFVQKTKGQILELGYSLQRDRFECPDLTRYASHLTEAGIKDLALTGAPDRMLWTVMEDGALACAAYDPKESLLGFCSRPLPNDMTAQSVTVITGSDGRTQQLWASVQYKGQAYIVRLARRRAAKDASDTKVMADLAFAYEGAPQAEFAVPWLAGEMVDVVADGMPSQAVADALTGAIVLDAPASRVMIGLPFKAWIELLPFEAGGDNGPSQGKRARIVKVMLRLLNSDGLRVNVNDVVSLPMETMAGNHAPGTAIPLYTGDYTLDTLGDWNTHRRIVIERLLPRPITLLGVMAHMAAQSTPGRHT